MTSSPRVRVIVPAFDQPEMLRDALQSVAAQDCDDFEVFVVDDGSTVDLRPVLEGARESLGERLRVLRQQQNAGGAAARNLALTEAQAPWIAFLDHDDVWMPDRIRRQLEFAESAPDAAMVFCQCREFGFASEDLVTPEHPAGRITLADLLGRTLIKTLSTVMLRRDALGDEAWFDTRYIFANDIDLYYRIAMRHEIQFLDEVLVQKRIHAGQATRNHVQSHDEMVAIVETFLEAFVDGGLAQPARRRWAHHLSRAAKDARRAGDRTGSRSRYRRLLRRCPGHLRAWRGYLGSFFG